MPSIKEKILLAFLLAPLSACTVSSGVDDLVDRSIQTSSVAVPDRAVEAEQLSDSRLVRNAVSAANLDAATGAPLAWSNADTGTSGLITAIQEVRAGGRICRQFTTSRQRFDGVSLYAGEACTAGQGEWTLTRFSEGG